MATRSVSRRGWDNSTIRGAISLTISFGCWKASPETVFAMIDNLDIEVDVLTAMSIKFDTGALCNISIVGHAYGGVREDFSIWLEEGALYLREGKLYRQSQEGSTRTY